jgi:hypothetical protein
MDCAILFLAHLPRLPTKFFLSTKTNHYLRVLQAVHMRKMGLTKQVTTVISIAFFNRLFVYFKVLNRVDGILFSVKFSINKMHG